MRFASAISSIKKAQKESLYLRTISKLFNQTAQDDAQLRGIFLSRVQLSDKKTYIDIFFHSMHGEEHFNKVLDSLILYKPSMRKALAQQIDGRYTPDLVFAYDKIFDKIQRIENLIEQVHSDEKDTSEK